MRFGFPILMTAMLVLPARFASAAGVDRIAIASFHATGEGLSVPGTERLRSSLRAGLAGAGYEVVPLAEVQAQRAGAGLVSCEAGPCLSRLAERLSASGMVRARVERVGSADYSITLEFYQPDPERLMARVNETCEVCTESEADEALSRAATELAARARGAGSAPESASSAEPTPARPLALRSAPLPPGRRALRIAGLVTGAVGVAALTFGFVELGLEHGCPVPGMSCPGQNDTSAGQAIGFAIGGVGLAAGAVLSIFGFSQLGARVAIAPAIGRHTATVRMALRFR